MNSIFKATALAVGFFATLHGTANATAVAFVNYAVYDIQFKYYAEYAPDGTVVVWQDYLPDGVTLTCNGGVSSGECADFETLSLENSSAAEWTSSLSSHTNLALHNSTQNAFSGLFYFMATFSAVAPFGDTEARVDNVLSEYATFSSQVFGDGVGDSHSCDTRDPSYGYHPTPNSCEVASPDLSDDIFTIGPLDPDETHYEYYTINIDLTAKGAPEPVSVSLLIGGLAGLGFFSRQKQKIQKA